MSRYFTDELCHYGVLGMRWGYRRYQPYPNGSFRDKRRVAKTINGQYASSRGAAKAQYKADVKSAKAHRKSSAARKERLYKEYGRTEDRATYGKGRSKSSVDSATKRLEAIDREARSITPRKTYREEKDLAKRTYKRNVAEAKRARSQAKYDAFTSPDQKVKDHRKRVLNNRRTVSDETLRKEINRMQLEKQYKELATEDLSKGRSYASQVMHTKKAKEAVAGAAAQGARAGAKHIRKKMIAAAATA